MKQCIRRAACDLGVELEQREVQPDPGLAVTRASEKLSPARSRASTVAPNQINHQKRSKFGV